jgi:hypothetical protein
VYKLSQKEELELEIYLGVRQTPWEYEKIFIKKAQKYSQYFKHCPWIEWIFLCNSVAMNSANQNSDIDLFIITKEKRLWTVRIYMTLFCIILRIRKNKKYHTWKFCLSFFVDTTALDFNKISIKKDIYLSYWCKTLIPLVNKGGIYEIFLEKNFWKDIQKNTVNVPTLLIKKSWYFSLTWDYIEYILKFLFLQKSIKKYEQLWKPFWIIIDTHILKFHNSDKRKIIRNHIWLKK